MSGLLDVGVVLPGINDDYVGAAPDVGAFEYQGYGFTLNAAPTMRAVAPGATTTYTLNLQAVGGFTATVTLTTSSPSPNLTLQLNPTLLALPGQSTLTVTNTYVAPLIPGVWHTLPITATGASITQTLNISLLVGGARLNLPIVLRNP
jgi:hypothetical protein